MDNFDIWSLMELEEQKYNFDRESHSSASDKSPNVNICSYGAVDAYIEDDTLIYATAVDPNDIFDDKSMTNYTNLENLHYDIKSETKPTDQLVVDHNFDTVQETYNTSPRNTQTVSATCDCLSSAPAPGALLACSLHAELPTINLHDVFWSNSMKEDWNSGHSQNRTSCGYSSQLPTDSNHTSVPAQLPTDSNYTSVPAHLPTDSNYTSVPAHLPTESNYTSVPAHVPTDSNYTSVPAHLPTDSNYTSVPAQLPTDSNLTSVTAQLPTDSNYTSVPAHLHTDSSRSPQWILPIIKKEFREANTISSGETNVNSETILWEDKSNAKGHLVFVLTDPISVTDMDNNPISNNHIPSHQNNIPSINVETSVHNQNQFLSNPTSVSPHFSVQNVTPDIQVSQEHSNIYICDASEPECSNVSHIDICTDMVDPLCSSDGPTPSTSAPRKKLKTSVGRFSIDKKPPRMSLVSLNYKEKSCRIREQNNLASKIYRQRKKERLKELVKMVNEEEEIFLKNKDILRVMEKKRAILRKLIEKYRFS